MKQSKAEDRTHRQCERILGAAERCFIEHGFHAASMSTIAEAADMSPGLIYRYFENKSAIVLAIMQRQLEIDRANMATLQTGCELGERIQNMYNRLSVADPTLMSPVLFLETVAHIHRDAQIAGAIGLSYEQSDREFGGWIRRTLEADGRTVTDQDVQARLLILRSFVEGLAIRSLRAPGPDTDALPEALKLLLPTLLPLPSNAPLNA